ncbi:MAG: TetR/AcrR family transcriptional regulator [Solirubrobacteraceae bacterium]|nr:TetR/AcrR family transcriptional regulator [Solirubrobacteraceae bacterium]
MSPTGEDGRGPRRDTRARIIDAAAGLYLSQGEASTTIEQIAAGAGVSAGSVYRYFGGKRELEEAMVDEALSRAEEYLSDARRDPSPMARVRGAGAAYFRVAVEFPVATRFFAARALRAGAPGSDRFDAAVTARTREMVISVAADLRQAMDTGEIPPGRVADALLFLWGAWAGVITQMVRRDDLAIDADAAARALDLGNHALTVALAQVRANPNSGEPTARLQRSGWRRISPPPRPGNAFA